MFSILLLFLGVFLNVCIIPFMYLIFIFQSGDGTCSTYIVVSISVQAILSVAERYNLSPEEALYKLAGYFYSLGADTVLDMTVADDFALLESAKEFVERYKAAKSGLKNQLPMLSSSCPGNTYSCCFRNGILL